MNFDPQMVNRFMQFRNSFRGDPQQMVQQMMQSGRVSQAQYQQAVQMANQLQSILTPSVHRW